MIRRRHCTEPTAGWPTPRRTPEPPPPPLVHPDAEGSAGVLGLLVVWGGGIVAAVYLLGVLLAGGCASRPEPVPVVQAPPPPPPPSVTVFATSGSNIFMGAAADVRIGAETNTTHPVGAAANSEQGAATRGR